MAPALIDNLDSSSGYRSPTMSVDGNESQSHDGPEPVAIIGMACRLPGESDSPEDFWQMLVDQRSGYTEPPASRWNVDGFHSTKTRPGSLRPRGGYFISEKLFNFDPQFFGITQTEAIVMDPAQRKLLECVYEAFESGGVPLEKVSGTNTAVYVGNFTYDYSIQGLREGDYPKPYCMTGAGVTILSNRISYVFNLCGPSLTLDTACSSSMYAAHMACRALQTGEVDGAIVGGSNLMLNIDVQMATDKMGVLSPTSTCHTFDETADGYGRAESIGALYLKRLSDAVRDGDPIRGVFRATASNANGKTSGITQPSALGQEAVIRSAYNFAGDLNPDQTSYFECHGTGTPVGDPIELNAISKVFLQQSYRESLLIGGVKPNVGHGEAGSAIASLIKVALALELGTIPATIGVKNYNPNIDFCGGRLQVVKNNIDWPSNFTARRASINSFGYGGANSHAIMESSESILPGYKSFAKQKTVSSPPEGIERAPKVLESMGADDSTFSIKERTEFLLPFSAADFPTLRNTVSSTRKVVERYELSDLAFTLSNHRSSFYNRGYTTVSEDTALEDLEDSQMTYGKRGNGAKICFIFTGQGAQSAQMGKELMQSFPTYLQTIRELDDVLQSLGNDSPSWKIEDSLLEPKATSSIDQVHLSQPLCTAIQIALVNLLQEWGVEPTACVGHSSGEIAAAYASGALDAKQAILYAYFRGVSVSDLKPRGKMLAVGLSPEDVTPYLEDGIRIACYNSPESVTLSGDEEVALNVKTKLEDEKVFVRELKTSGKAYHSHHMASVGGGYEELANAAMDRIGALGRRNHEKNIRLPTFISSVTGVEKHSFFPGARYWRQNLESPVRFTQALTRALELDDLGINHLIEIGPHSALAGPVRQLKDSLNLTSRDLEYTPTLVRGESSVTRLLNLAGNLFIKGYPVKLAQVNSVQKMVNGVITTKSTLPIVDLPRYSWNYTNGTNLRSENRISAELRTRKFPRHDLLGARVLGGIRDQAQWRNLLDSHDLPWLEHHKLGPQPVLPATGYLAIAVEAARQFYDGKVELTGPFRFFFPQIAIKAALRIPSSGAIEVLTSMRFQRISNNFSSKTWLEFTIQSLHEGSYTDHCVGVIGIKDIEPVSPMLDEARLQEPKASHTWHRGLASIGLNYGPAFTGMNDLRTDPELNEVAFSMKLHPDTIPEDDSHYLVHPGTMDKCLQAGIIAAHHGSLKNLERSFIPVSFEEVSLWSHGGADIPPPTDEECRGFGSARFTSLRGLTGAFQLFGADGRPLFEAKHIYSIAYAENVNRNTLDDRHPHLRVLWKPDIDQFPQGPLPMLATSYGELLSAPERAVLSTWAQNLAAAATNSADQSPLADMVKKWIPTQDSNLVNLDSASLDMCAPTTHKAFLKLEAIYISMINALRGQSGPLKSEDNTNGTASASFRHTLDLVAHKYPSMDILKVIANDTDLDVTVPFILGARSSLKRYRSFTYVSASEDLLEAAREKFSESRETTYVEGDFFSSAEELSLEDGYYDLIILPSTLSVPPSEELLINVQRLLKPMGRVLIQSNQESIPVHSDHEMLLDVIARELHSSMEPQASNFAVWKSTLAKYGFESQVADEIPAGWTILSERTRQDVSSYTKVVLLSRSAIQSSATDAFFEALADRGWELSKAFLSDDEFVVDSNAIYLSIVEFAGSLFNGGLTEKELSNLQELTGGEVPAIFWVTTGDLLGKVNPDAAMVMGLGRTLQNENPLITFCTVDLDHNDATKGASQIAHLLQGFSKESKESDDVDKEYIVKGDLFHVSRLSEDSILDHQYSDILNSNMADETYNASTRIRLDIENLGLINTLHFKEDHRDLSLEPHEAEVEVKAVGLNMKESATFRGSFNSETLSHEGAGIVINVGSAVTNVKVGDRVCYIGKGMFGNHEKMPAMLMHKIPDDAKFEEIATMPLVFSTAIYGLLHLGRLKKGETVLIHSATGGVGLAAIQIAKMVGAEIFATVGTEEKREFLKAEYGLDDSHIYNSRNTSFAAAIMEATGGRGIDVALNSLVREFLKASWSTMARNGRHVEIGRTDLMDHGTLDLNIFQRSTTFSAFDLGVAGEETPEIPAKVMAEVMQYYEQGFIKPLNPRHIYPASDVATAFQHFGDGNRMGKVVVTFDPTDKPMDRIKVLHTKDGMKFRPDGSYLLVGCLGGLGRCLARWMVDRGAKILTFLGRTGAKSKAAATMVNNLRARGVTIHVVTGDVANKADVERAVKASGVPTLGMVQGAMALEDKLFSKLDLPGWQYPIDPKVKGTWNLHECLVNQPLDFFVMLGSIAAMTGAVTQSNYGAGNTFLDFFARYRANLGLPATTVGLTMVLEVGFVSQNLAIEQGISRSGIHGINESDFLLLMEAAMKKQASPSWLLDPNANRMLVSGLDPAILGKDIDIHSFRFWKQPRVGPVLTAIRGAGTGENGKSKLKLEASDVFDLVCEKFSSTFMIPVEDIDAQKPLLAYGMDSMIGTALRNWAFSQFGTDIPASDLMGPSLTARSLSELIFAGIVLQRSA